MMQHLDVARRRTARIVAVAATIVVATAPVAGAHVTVDPEEATQGRFAYLEVRVPNERPDARTVEVSFGIPTEHPITTVQVRPTPGWQYAFETTTLDEPIEQDGGAPITEVVSAITWSGGAVAPTEFAGFDVVLGPLPEGVDELRFPTTQTYDSGEQVSWSQEGGHEAEFPAPTLRLVPAQAHEAGHHPDDASVTPLAAPAAEDLATGEDVDGVSRVALAGVVAGLVGVVVSGFAVFRTRSRAGAPAPEPGAGAPAGPSAEPT